MLVWFMEQLLSLSVGSRTLVIALAAVAVLLLILSLRAQAKVRAFKVSISLKGHDSYGNDVGMWRENAHDDLVLAVALAAWFGENAPARTVIPPARVHRTAR